MTDIGDMIERGSEGPEWYQYPQDNAFQRLLYRNQELAAEVGRLQEELLAANAELGGRDIAAGRTVSYDHMKELTALRAEVERLRAAMLGIGLAIDSYDASSDRAKHDYDMVCAGGRLYDAVLGIHDSWKLGLDPQPMPSPPTKEE